jgi:propanol-preferring alcohol dehydrogenase
MHVVAADIFDDKLKLATELGADVVVNGTAADAIEQVQKATGGVHGALVTAVSPKAMEQAYGFLRSKGTMALVGLPPGFISLPVFETVLKRITVRGSIVGTRQDLEESLQFAGEGKVASHFSWDKLENINAIFDRMKEGKIDGRIVLDLAA